MGEGYTGENACGALGPACIGGFGLGKRLCTRDGDIGVKVGVVAPDLVQVGLSDLNAGVLTFGEARSDFGNALVQHV